MSSDTAFPKQYRIQFRDSGYVSEVTDDYYTYVSNDSYTVNPRAENDDTYENSDRSYELLGISGSFDGISLLIDQVNFKGTGMGIPDPTMEFSYNEAENSMTLILPRLDRGEYSGNLDIQNVFISSTELSSDTDGTEIKLYLTEYAKFYTANSGMVLSPECFSDGQQWYAALNVLFYEGDISDCNDLSTWGAPGYDGYDVRPDDYIEVDLQ